MKALEIGGVNIKPGETMYHIAYFRKPDSVAKHLELLQGNFVLAHPSIID